MTEEFTWTFHKACPRLSGVAKATTPSSRILTNTKVQRMCSITSHRVVQDLGQCETTDPVAHEGQTKKVFHGGQTIKAEIDLPDMIWATGKTTTRNTFPGKIIDLIVR